MALSDAAPPVFIAPADPLQALRHATRAIHARLDTELAIAQPAASLADYATHVHALAAWLQALSPQLIALQADVPGFDFAPACRLEHLQADLQDLASAPGSRALRWPAPGAATHERVETTLRQHPHHHPAVRWGVSYVVEGSQLGGQVLHGRLAERLAPHPLRYLQGQCAGTAWRWKTFVSLLRGHLASPEATAAACAGALAAFHGLQDEFKIPQGPSR